MSEWLDLMLEEIERKNQERTAAENERAARAQDEADTKRKDAERQRESK